jgi:hypothetical protein
LAGKTTSEFQSLGEKGEKGKWGTGRASGENFPNFSRLKSFPLLILSKYREKDP